MPFGAVTGGFLHRGASGWAHAWLHLVQLSLQATAMLHPNFTPDFLLAKMGDDPARPLFLAPLSRSEGVVLLRRLFYECYQHTPASSRPKPDLLGVHSLKVTLLSYGRQLLIREDLQRQQGHHRASIAGMSDLYGRDDVAGPLEFQRQVVGAVLEGFRPRRPRLRGGLPPTADIDIQLPTVPGTSDMPSIESNPLPQPEQDTSSGSDAEAVAPASPIPLPPPTQELPEAVAEALSMTLEPLPPDASSSSGVAEDWTEVHGPADEYFFLLNGVSRIAHKAQPCCSSHPAFQLKVAHLQRSFRAGCSVRGVELGSFGSNLLFWPLSAAMDTSSSYDSDSASTSFSSNFHHPLEDLPETPRRPVLRIRPRDFHEPELLSILGTSSSMEREILLRDEITLWESAWGSVDVNHRVLLFSGLQTWLAVALGNRELHRCVSAALHLEM
ncbi:unnamed protein product [Symbiodinium sp. CCMP2456]|nr:unnamed protein product [Symbiodinium sp. CCMP2456]